MRRKPIIIGQAHRIEPELRLMIASLHVNVRRLVTFVRIKMKPIAILSQHGRHDAMFSSFERNHKIVG
jgi:hypothetical protein